ncbi:MAG: cytochrome C oxidase subunit IV family protein [Anaerolineales bacterium]|jgi:cytochrome c oxidase subunit 4
MEQQKTSVSVRVYAVVFVVLGAITAFEIFLSLPSTGVARQILTPLFVVLSLSKASLVAAFYMHLRGDSRFYTIVFVLPALLLLVFALLATIS